MAWWAWVILGCLLVLAETLTPGGFYIVFFGIGALAVGLMDILGMAGPAWVQWLLFSAVSLASLAFLRRPLLKRFSTAQSSASRSPMVDTDTLVGEIAVASESIPAGSVGRVEMRGAAWNACNRGANALALGQRCVVENVEGLMLDVRAK